MSDKPTIIFLNGPKEVGKTSVARMLMSEFPGKAMIVAHADPLAWATSEMFWSGGDMVAPLKDSEVKKGPLPGFDHVLKSTAAEPIVGEIKTEPYVVDGKIVGHTLKSPFPKVNSLSRPYTVRDWMIALGHFTRQQLGLDALSRLLLRRMIENEGFIQYFIVEGCRTNEDIETIVEHYGPTSCLVVRLYREGRTFEGDLGYYIEPEKYKAIKFLDLHNDGLLEDVVDTIVENINAEA